VTLSRLLQALRPRRTIRPTRDGWWCLAAAVALGFAAMNTANNLLYLMASLLLGLIIVSGMLSEQSMRGLRLLAVVPEEIYAGRAALIGARVANRKRWLASYSVALETGGQRLYLERLPAGEERLVTWEARFDTRGRHRLAGLRVTTRFPFGLFVKAGRLVLDDEVLVFPAVRPLEAAWRRRLTGAGTRPRRRRGRGDDVYNLRDYRAGDDPRLIHWRSTAKTGALVVRELEAETAVDTRIVLVGDGTRDPARLETALSEAASIAAQVIAAGAAVEVVGPGVHVPAGRGRAHLRRALTALALYEPGHGAGARRRAPSSAVADIEVALG
jgi:uncharacterized protein (DUF58 family)